jgi:hypothetical protein
MAAACIEDDEIRPSSEKTRTKNKGPCHLSGLVTAPLSNLTFSCHRLTENLPTPLPLATYFNK